jgi:O-antigen ligase
LQTLAIGLPLAVALGLALPMLLWLAYNRIIVGLVIVLATFFIEVVYIEYPGLWLGIYVYPTDLVFAFLALVALARLFFARDFPQRSLPWLLFGAVLATSFVMGLVQFGKAAGTDFRNYFYVWICVLYFMSFPIDEARTKQIVKVWLVFTGLLLGLACFRWFAEFSGMSIAATWRDSGGTAEFRVLPAHATLYLVDTAMILTCAIAAHAAKRWAWVAVPVLLAVVLVLQHRSVWIAAAAGIAALYVVFPGRVRLKLARPIVAAVAILAVVLGGLTAYGKLDTLMDKVTDSAATATDLHRGTGGGRLYGWQQLLMQLEPAQYIIGKPFGSGYERYEYPNVRWKAMYDPHNFYVQTLLRTGVIGLALVLAVYAVTLRRLLRDKEETARLDLPPRLVFTMLIAQMIFIVPYRLSYEQAIWLGLAISMAASLLKFSVKERSRFSAAAHAETQPS